MTRQRFRENFAVQAQKNIVLRVVFACYKRRRKNLPAVVIGLVTVVAATFVVVVGLAVVSLITAFWFKLPKLAFNLLVSGHAFTMLVCLQIESSIKSFKPMLNMVELHSREISIRWFAIVLRTEEYTLAHFLYKHQCRSRFFVYLPHCQVVTAFLVQKAIFLSRIVDKCRFIKFNLADGNASRLPKASKWANKLKQNVY